MEGGRRKEEGRRMKEEGRRRKGEGGRRKEEGGRRKEEGGSRKEEGGRRKDVTVGVRKGSCLTSTSVGTSTYLTARGSSNSCVRPEIALVLLASYMVAEPIPIQGSVI